MFQTPTGSIPIITRNRVFESSSYEPLSISADQALIAASFPSATSSAMSFATGLISWAATTSLVRPSGVAA